MVRFKWTDWNGCGVPQFESIFPMHAISIWRMYQTKQQQNIWEKRVQIESEILWIGAMVAKPGASRLSEQENILLYISHDFFCCVWENRISKSYRQPNSTTTATQFFLVKYRFFSANDSIAVYVQVADVTKAKFIDSLSQCCSQAYITFWHFQLIVVKCVCARTLRSYVGNTKNPFNRCTDQTRCLYIYSRRLWWTTIKLQLCKKRIETDKYINRNECISNSKSYHVIKRVLLRE